MILALVFVVVLVLVAIAVSYLNLKAAKHQEEAAQALMVSTEQVIDAVVGAQEASDRAVEAASRLQMHQASLNEMREENLATRKQLKGLLHDAGRVLATGDRLLAKQYQQQKDVDDILYHARVERERQERGELNG